MISEWLLTLSLYTLTIAGLARPVQLEVAVKLGGFQSERQCNDFAEIFSWRMQQADPQNAPERWECKPVTKP